MRSSASQLAGNVAGFLKNGKSGLHCWGRDVSTQFAVTAPPLVGCVIWNQSFFSALLVEVFVWNGMNNQSLGSALLVEVFVWSKADNQSLGSALIVEVFVWSRVW